MNSVISEIVTAMADKQDRQLTLYTNAKLLIYLKKHADSDLNVSSELSRVINEVESKLDVRVELELPEADYKVNGNGLSFMTSITCNQPAPIIRIYDLRCTL